MELWRHSFEVDTDILSIDQSGNKSLTYFRIVCILLSAFKL